MKPATGFNRFYLAIIMSPNLNVTDLQKVVC